MGPYSEMVCQDWCPEGPSTPIHGNYSKSYLRFLPNYPSRHPKYHLMETIRPLIGVHCGGAGLGLRIEGLQMRGPYPGPNLMFRFGLWS